MKKEIKKAKVPTSELSIYCDHFDSKVNISIHNPSGRQIKLLVEIGNIDTKTHTMTNNQSLSLYREDVEVLISSLNAMVGNLDRRN